MVGMWIRYKFLRGEWSTSIESGSSLNVTWHLGYPHQGGYKIELRDGDDVFLRSLSSDTASEDDAEWISDDTTAQSHQVLPVYRVSVGAQEHIF